MTESLLGAMVIPGDSLDCQLLLHVLGIIREFHRVMTLMEIYYSVANLALKMSAFALARAEFDTCPKTTFLSSF